MTSNHQHRYDIFEHQEKINILLVHSDNFTDIIDVGCISKRLQELAPNFSINKTFYTSLNKKDWSNRDLDCIIVFVGQGNFDEL